MLKNSYIPVPASFSQAELQQALRDGRLFISQPEISDDDARDCILNLIARIDDFATNRDAAHRVWLQLLGSHDQINSFFFRHADKDHAVCSYRVAACVRQMYNCGLYNPLVCNFSMLCRTLFAEDDADSVRRNSSNYLRLSDIQIIADCLTSFNL